MKLSKLSLSLVICLMCIPEWGFPQTTIGAGQSDSYEKANRLFDQHRFDLALNFYKELVADQNTSALVLFRKAYSHLQCMQFADAERVFGKLLLSYPDHQQGWFYLGYTYRMQGKYESAANCYDKLAELNPAIGVFWQNINFPIQSDLSASNTYYITSEIVREGSHELFVSLLQDKIICATTKMDYNTDNSKYNGPNFSAGSNQLCILNPDTKSINPYYLFGQQGFNVSHVSFSNRSGLIAYTTNTFFPEMRQVGQIQSGLNIHFSYLESDGSWVDSSAFDFNDNLYSTGYPFLTENGNTLYFASNMPGGYGGFDLYVSYFIDSVWSVPQNLGPRINTPGDEISPFMEGSILFFSSDWHPGFGGMDIFKTDFNYDSWKDPVNLGASINSSFDDFGYVYFERYNKGYFISNRKGITKGENLYEFQKTTKKVALELLDFKRKKPITGALVDLSRCGCASGISDAKGLYEFDIQEGFDCIVGIYKVGYQGSHMQIRHREIEGNKKKIKLLLNANGHFNKGTVAVYENDTLLGVSGVLITAVNEADGEAQETFSEAGGGFELQIKPRGRYYISFVKTGYRYYTKEFQTANIVDKDILGNIILEPADNVALKESFDSSPLSISSALPSTAGVIGKQKEIKPSSMKSNSTSRDLVVNRGGKIDVSHSYHQSAGQDQNVQFVIQVAAIRKKNIDITPFKTKLSPIGDLYYTLGDDNMIRIVVGIFSSKQDALDAMQKVTAHNIFEKSFISTIVESRTLFPLDDLPQRNNKLEREMDMSNQMLENTFKVQDEIDVNTRSPKDILKKKISPNTEDIGKQKEYLVQIGRFKNLNWFSDREIENIGLIEERREGGYILVLLSGFAKLEDAKIALQQAFNLGYKESIIVSPNANGILEKIRY